MTLPAAVVAFVNSILSVVVQFGISLTDAQIASITGLVNGALVLGAIAMHYRQKANGLAKQDNKAAGG